MAAMEHHKCCKAAIDIQCCLLPDPIARVTTTKAAARPAAQAAPRGWLERAPPRLAAAAADAAAAAAGAAPRAQLAHSHGDGAPAPARAAAPAEAYPSPANAAAGVLRVRWLAARAAPPAATAAAVLLPAWRDESRTQLRAQTLSYRRPACSSSWPSCSRAREAGRTLRCLAAGGELLHF